MSFLNSREQVAPQGIGKPVRRREDARLLTGGGRFADDVSRPGQAYAYIVRSPHAHAQIVGIDTGRAEGMPGVIAVLTAAMLKETACGQSRTVLCPQTLMRCRSRTATARPSSSRRIRFWRSARSAMWAGQSQS